MPAIRKDEIAEKHIHFVGQQQTFALPPIVADELELPLPQPTLDATLRGIYSQAHATQITPSAFSPGTVDVAGMSTVGSASSISVVSSSVGVASFAVMMACKAPVEEVRRNILRFDTRNGRLDSLNSLEEEADKSYTTSLNNDWIQPESREDLAKSHVSMQAVTERARLALDNPTGYRRLALMLPWSTEASQVASAMEAINDFKTDVSDSSKKRREAAAAARRRAPRQPTMASLQEESAAHIEPVIAPDSYSVSRTSHSSDHGGAASLTVTIGSALALPRATDSAVDLSHLARGAALELQGRGGDGGRGAPGSADVAGECAGLVMLTIEDVD